MGGSLSWGAFSAYVVEYPCAGGAVCLCRDLLFSLSLQGLFRCLDEELCESVVGSVALL